MTVRKFVSDGGDRCDSDYERLLINDLIKRGVEYLHHPGPYSYWRPVRSGYCGDCDGDNVRKGAMYTPDLQIVRSGVIIEAKGGSTTVSSRSRLTHFTKNSEDGISLYFIFRDNRFIKKGSKTRHVDWAAKLVGQGNVTTGMRIPEEWL